MEMPPPPSPSASATMDPVEEILLADLDVLVDDFPLSLLESDSGRAAQYANGDAADADSLFTAAEADLLLATLDGAEGVALVEHTLGGAGAVAAATAAPPQPPQKKKVASRTRQIQEMEYLRSQVVELEAELERLKQTPSRGANEPPGALSVSAASPSRDAIWKAIAKRQTDEKRRAEAENMTLRGMLEGQLRVAQSLEKLLHKRSLAESATYFDVVKRPRVTPRIQDGPTPKGTLPARLHSQLEELDTIMAESGLRGAAEELDDAQMKTSDEQGIFLERTMTKIFPFSLVAVAKASWRRITVERLELSNGHYGTSREADDQYHVQFSVKTKVRRLEAQVEGKGGGCRQSLADGREAIVWQTDGMFTGTAFREGAVGLHTTAYMVIEPLRTPSDVETSIVKICVRISPRIDDDAYGVQPGLLVDLTLSSFDQNAMTMLQLIENDLLEQSLRATAPTHPAAAQ